MELSLSLTIWDLKINKFHLLRILGSTGTKATPENTKVARLSMSGLQGPHPPCQPYYPFWIASVQTFSKSFTKGALSQKVFFFAVSALRVCDRLSQGPAAIPTAPGC